MTATDHTSQDFGANSWLVDEMYGQYVADPESVSESWREFFSDYRGQAAAAPAPAAPPPAAGSSGRLSMVFSSERSRCETARLWM